VLKAAGALPLRWCAERDDTTKRSQCADSNVLETKQRNRQRGDQQDGCDGENETEAISSIWCKKHAHEEH